MKTEKELKKEREDLFASWDKNNIKEEMLCHLGQKGGEWELVEKGDLDGENEEELAQFKEFLKEDIANALINKGKKLKGG